MAKSKPHADTIFTANLKVLMGWDEKTGKTKVPQAFLAKNPRHKVAQSTIGRILRGEQTARLTTVQAVAAHFGYEAWQLLMDGFNPANTPTVGTQAAFFNRVQELAKQMGLTD